MLNKEVHQNNGQSTNCQIIVNDALIEQRVTNTWHLTLMWGVFYRLRSFPFLLFFCVPFRCAKGRIPL